MNQTLQRRFYETFQQRKLIDFEPYKWQSEFYKAGLENKQRALMAANQVGKTHCAAHEVACHLTGLYPFTWQGHQFESNIDVWALGVSNEQIRDVIQPKLLGKFENGQLNSEGIIPSHLIETSSVIKSSQTKDLVKSIKIKHISGKYSQLSFKSYSQGQHVLMGSIVDLIWIDEEPKDQQIYPQCLTRTINGDNNKGGHVLLTFTPENGMTPLVTQFTDDIKKGQYLKNVTWDDAEHLDEETKEQILSAYPVHQRAMRSKGVPVLGSGQVYTIADDKLKVDPFKIPGHWKIINGIDFGYNHPQAFTQLVLDVDTDTIYVTYAFKKSEVDPYHMFSLIKHAVKKYPVAWPHDGLQREKTSGNVVKDSYKESGFNMLPERATWVNGGNSVEAGLWEINNLMEQGKFKVFSNCHMFFEEKNLYHRDDRGKIVKQNDDILDALRYAYMMLRFAVSKDYVINTRKVKPKPIKPIRTR